MASLCHTIHGQHRLRRGNRDLARFAYCWQQPASGGGFWRCLPRHILTAVPRLQHAPAQVRLYGSAGLRGVQPIQRLERRKREQQQQQQRRRLDLSRLWHAYPRGLHSDLPRRRDGTFRRRRHRARRWRVAAFEKLRAAAALLSRHANDVVLLDRQLGLLVCADAATRS